jgi:ABC-2 type transport system ATP-binding protein
VTRLSLDLVSHAELVRVSAALMSGAHVVLGTERDGTDTLVRLCAGFMQPSAGRVTVDDRAPFAHADSRRSAGTLFADERLPPARDVARSVELALRARHDARSAATVLDAAGMAQFAARRISDLAPRETRALALALALSHPKPTLLALFEPLTLVDLLSEELIVQALTRHAAAGAVVLATASRIEDAARLGGATSALERGIWLDSAAARPPLSQVTLRVHTPEPRRLAARLSEAPDVSAVEWAGGRELLVRGSDLERVAAQVVASARSEAIRIDALRYDPPGLDALAAARAGLAQAWYERAQREAQAPERAAAAPTIFAVTKGSA